MQRQIEYLANGFDQSRLHALHRKALVGPQHEVLILAAVHTLLIVIIAATDLPDHVADILQLTAAIVQVNRDADRGAEVYRYQ